MSISRTRAAAVIGVEGFVVDVEAAVTAGVPGLHLYGLPETSFSEVRDRVRAAIHNSGLPWPNRHVTVGLHPVSLPKHGSGYDLVIAIAILAANGTIPEAVGTGAVYLAELGLDGTLRPIEAILPGALAAVAAGYSTIVVAGANAAEASAAPGTTVVAADTLTDIVRWLRGGRPPMTSHPQTQSPRESQQQTWPDLADLPDWPELRQALEASAAGGHHLQLVGRHGVHQMGRALVPLLPDLSPDAAVQVTAIHSAAGLLDPQHPMITRPPYRCPSPSSSRTLLCGSHGRTTRPGEIALAHHGVLHLADAPEFTAGTLDALRGPLEDRYLTVERADTHIHYPARFLLLTTMAPCPCGGAHDTDCTCQPVTVHRYQGRLGGPILDHIDIKVRLPDPQPSDILGPPEQAAASSVAAAERVTTARGRAARRLAGTPWTTNAEIPTPELRRRFQPPYQAIAPLETAMRTGTLSARGATRIIRLAWTLADLAGRDIPTTADVTTALDLYQPVHCSARITP